MCPPVKEGGRFKKEKKRLQGCKERGREGQDRLREWENQGQYNQVKRTEIQR